MTMPEFLWRGGKITLGGDVLEPAEALEAFAQRLQEFKAGRRDELRTVRSLRHALTEYLPEDQTLRKRWYELAKELAAIEPKDHAASYFEQHPELESWGDADALQTALRALHAGLVQEGR